MTSNEIEKLIDRDNSTVKRVCLEAYADGHLDNIAQQRSRTRKFQLRSPLPPEDKVVLPSRSRLVEAMEEQTEMTEKNGK